VSEGKDRFAIQVAETMKSIWDAGMTTATGGNISVRDQEGNIWTTPSGVDKGSLSDEDIVCVKPDGTFENRKGYTPTSEFSFHRAVYQANKDLNAVIHAHSPALVSYSLAGKVPDTELIPEIEKLCGKAGFAPYKISGSEDLAEQVAGQVLDGHHCIIMENHATVVAGTTLSEAFQRFEAFETCAQIIINANRLGKVNSSVSDVVPAHGMNLPEISVKTSLPGEDGTRENICNFMSRACRHNLMISSSGAISARLNRDSFIITPDGKDRRNLDPGDIVQIQDGCREPDKFPDLTWQIHLDIYNRHPEVQSIFTSCAPFSMSFGISGTSIDTKASPEGYVLLREINQLELHNPWNMSQKLSALISDEAPCILVKNHFLLITGASILQAFERLEVAESTAKSLINAIPIGGAKKLGNTKLKELKNKFLS
jgi:L-fuculose-phosphate aldolase